jgi:hypothetical protein
MSLKQEEKGTQAQEIAVYFFLRVASTWRNPKVPEI